MEDLVISLVVKVIPHRVSVSSSTWKYATAYIYLYLVFTCVNALAIAGALHHVDKDLLGWWLCERQLKNGGLNGRPEKLEDVSRRLHLRNECFTFNDYWISLWLGLLLLVGAIVAGNHRSHGMDQSRKIDWVHPLRPGKITISFRLNCWPFLAFTFTIIHPCDY